MKVAELIKKVRDAARQRGIRWTHQRQTIVETFAALGEHITAEDLHRKVREIDRSVSAATVYRTVNLLVELGVAEKGHFGGGSASFEMALHKDHHDHLVCEACGAIIEFHCEAIEDLQESIAKEHGYVLKTHRMELYGICPACQAGVDDDVPAAVEEDAQTGD